MPDGLGLGEWKEREVRNVTPPEFPKFPKIPRYNRHWIITEKLDGTNGVIRIFEGVLPEDGPYYVQAGSRNRWISPGQNDNHGFAAWVYEHGAELYELLGTGTHHGEWWGAGIGKRYPERERQFSLFNTDKFRFLTNPDYIAAMGQPVATTVPVLAHAQSFDELSYFIDQTLDNLTFNGSFAAPGCKSEGIVIYSVAAGQYFKITLENDGAPKGQDRIS